MYRLVAIGTALMAIAAAVAYVLMGMGIIQAGNLTDEAMPSFFYIIPTAYVMMGFGVFLRWRWIKIADAILVFLTIAVFYARYADQPDVLWSVPGLITKIAQVLMLAGLIYLLVKSKPIKAPEAK